MRARKAANSEQLEKQSEVSVTLRWRIFALISLIHEATTRFTEEERVDLSTL